MKPKNVIVRANLKQIFNIPASWANEISISKFYWKWEKSNELPHKRELIIILLQGQGLGKAAATKGWPSNMREEEGREYVNNGHPPGQIQFIIISFDLEKSY